MLSLIMMVSSLSVLFKLCIIIHFLTQRASWEVRTICDLKPSILYSTKLVKYYSKHQWSSTVGTLQLNSKLNPSNRKCHFSGNLRMQVF